MPSGVKRLSDCAEQFGPAVSVGSDKIRFSESERSCSYRRREYSHNDGVDALFQFETFPL
jgi:hypothetical protein